MNKNLKTKEDVLRYLGYKNQKIDSITEILIQESIDEIKTLIRARYTYKSFKINRNEDEIELEGSSLSLLGDDIKRHLGKSENCILIAATLGHHVDTKIKYYEKVDMTKALILDSCATVFIEELCDGVCSEIENNLKKDQKKLTSRYSPGYGDLSIEIQNDFLLNLDAKRIIGLNASSNSILIPRKSVTAIVGIIEKDEEKKERACTNCNKYSTCRFKKGGNICEY